MFLRVVVMAMFMPLAAFGADLKVLSFNVYMLPKPIKSSLQKERDAAMPKRLANSDYDIMVFQEAFSPTFRKTMIKELSEKYPFNYYLDKPNSVFQILGSGVFVMSRHPFEVLDTTTFKDCTAADCFAAKGALLIEVSMPSGEHLQIVGTHMNAGTDQKNADVRVTQYKDIAEMLKRAKKPSVPQMLVGDLNTNNLQPEFAKGLEMTGMVFTPISGEPQTTSARVNDCYTTPTFKQWIDHVWVDRENANLQSTLQAVPLDFEWHGKTCPLSDHNGVAAHLYLGATVNKQVGHSPEKIQQILDERPRL